LGRTGGTREGWLVVAVVHTPSKAVCSNSTLGVLLLMPSPASPFYTYIASFSSIKLRKTSICRTACRSDKCAVTNEWLRALCFLPARSLSLSLSCSAEIVVYGSTCVGDWDTWFLDGPDGAAWQVDEALGHEPTLLFASGP
jgi:hypothetical protein